MERVRTGTIVVGAASPLSVSLDRDGITDRVAALLLETGLSAEELAGGHVRIDLSIPLTEFPAHEGHERAREAMGYAVTQLAVLNALEPQRCDFSYRGWDGPWRIELAWWPDGEEPGLVTTEPGHDGGYRQLDDRVWIDTEALERDELGHVTIGTVDAADDTVVLQRLGPHTWEQVAFCDTYEYLGWYVDPDDAWEVFVNRWRHQPDAGTPVRSHHAGD